MKDNDVSAPFNNEQIKKIEAYQKCDWLHPLTCCGENGCRRTEENNFGVLTPTKDGLVCPCGKYTQADVPAFVFGDLPEDPFKRFNIPEDGEA